jgi:tetratricopeptide (TPR) repeat protein
MLGIVVFLVLIVIAAVAAYFGLFGRWAETAASQVLDNAIAAADRWYASFDKLGKVAGFVITLLTGAYAIYQKYYFAEFNMHKRLREFQERVNARLKEANAHIAKAAQRPSPRRKFEDPIFEDETLNPVLRQMKWGKRPRADQSLEATLKELEEQLDLWNGQKREYEQRKAQACLLRGAIAAARAAKIGRNDGAEARKDNIEALEYFREAFELSGRADAEALEYIGHQQVRLGDYAPALTTFQQLASMATQGQSLQRARALKFQAEVYACKPQPNLNQANTILIAAVGALPLNAPNIESAEIHEMHGRVRDQLGYGKATDSYTAAELWYQRIVDGKNSDDVPAAKDGLNRVRKALQDIRLRPLTQASDGGAIVPPPDAPEDGP